MHSAALAQHVLCLRGWDDLWGVHDDSHAAFGNHPLITARVHFAEPVAGQRTKQRAGDSTHHTAGERTNNGASRGASRVVTFSMRGRIT